MESIKEKLRQGYTTIGTWMHIPSTAVAEIIGNAGYDWAAIDLEHGSFSLDMIPGLCMALERGNTVPFARIAQAHPKDIKQALDAGVKGLILPMICSKKELEDAISWAYYPPKGSRGVGYSRANLYGKNFKEGLQENRNELVIIAQIEHIKAVESLDDILSTQNLDGIIIGPYDLSASMGLTSQFEHDDFITTLKEINEKASHYGIPMGLHIVEPDIHTLQDKIKEGYQFIAYGIDAVFLYQSSKCPHIEG
jgi:2-dehydro-3-deoxyglucarate aldolase